ncbi:hypothetical protein CDL15_Pgr007174 [Punica granatum]|uniref:BZIP domain-containing protein n=1 Tax=Punica granatum TaxID=22663 RepID=A0A218X881_PUNGR|nr:hypothetical protein CDL15_Pgr007174 [Punica granatum]
MDSPLIDDLISQFPLDDLFDELPDTAGPFLGDAAAASSPDSLSSWIDEIESFLMEDDAGDAAVESNTELSDSLLAELIAQSPENASGEVVDGSSDRDSDASADGGGQLQKEKVESEAGEEEDADDDPASKKRRRQLRNKDAAVRSRERKKMHVKDLEMKSKYLEGECRRMGRLLQCLVAENQALRLGLQNGSACGAIGTKQESAVLLLGDAALFIIDRRVYLLFCRIPAVGFPALVPGRHVPIHPARVAPVEGVAGKRRKERSANLRSKRAKK